MKSDLYKELIQSWPSPLVARQEISKFSGGVLNPRTMANRDCLERNNPGFPLKKILAGGRICYRKTELAAYLVSLIEGN
jgi:hypothetical protein